MLYIGIDGGGTKTKCVLADDNLKIISSAEGKASNPLAVSFDNSANILIKLIKQVLSKKKSAKDISIVAGIAGCGREAHAQHLKVFLENELKKHGINFESLKIVSDAEIAFEGALGGKSGALLIAGTGSILFGKDKNGNLFRTGGYGKIIGDEGSGFSIGRKGLNAVAKYLDGRGEKTILTEYLMKEFAINNRDDLITSVYSKEFDIPNTTRFVINSADKGDKICRQIINEEIEELILHIKAFQKEIDEKEFPLALSGGLLTNKNFYSQEFKEKVAKQLKGIKIKRAKYPPEIGAVILAKRIFHYYKS